MNSQAAQRVVLGAWLGMITLATIRRVTAPTDPGLPAPSVFLGISVLFTMLFGAAGFMPAFAAAIAVGADVGALLAPYAKGYAGGVAPIAQLAGFLDQLAGTPPVAPAFQAGSPPNSKT